MRVEFYQFLRLINMVPNTHSVLSKNHSENNIIITICYSYFNSTFKALIISR